MEKGYVHVYTGNGKGKTTAMLGLALRAAGAGLGVYILQFMKSLECSELKAVREFLPNVEIEQYGTGCILDCKVVPEDTACAEEGLAKAIEAIQYGNYDVVMLDEINVAVSLGLLKVADVVDMIRQKPPHLELVLTGRHAVAEVIDAADLVSEIQEIKHYFTNGVSARVGIEK